MAQRTRSRSLSEQRSGQSDEKGPAARRRPKAAREAYSLYVERAAEGANEANGPLSSLQGGDRDAVGAVPRDRLGHQARGLRLLGKAAEVGQRGLAPLRGGDRLLDRGE